MNNSKKRAFERKSGSTYRRRVPGEMVFLFFVVVNGVEYEDKNEVEHLIFKMSV